MHLRLLTCCVWFAVILTCVKGSATTEIETLEQDYWDWQMKIKPTISTYRGLYTYNDVMESFNVTMFNTSRTEMENLMTRLQAITRDDLDKSGKVNYDILKDSIQTFLDGNLWSMYGALTPVNFLGGIQLFNAPAIAYTLTRTDYDNYITRLHAVQKQVDEIKDSSRLAIQLNRTLHNVSLIRVPDQIDRKIFNTSEDSPYYEVFKDPLGNSSIPQADWETIRSQGRDAVQAYMDAFRDLKRFVVDEYMPHTRTEWGVYAWDPSHAYYKACLRWHLSFEMTPDDVHAKGLEEVARISGEMHKIMSNLGFEGAVSEFFKSLEGDSRFYSNDTDLILKEYNDTVFKRINPKLPELFRDIPDIPLVITASSYDGLGGGYSSATDDSPGEFSINLFRPLEVPFFEMMVLSLHEANPGHHLQHSFSMKAHLPDFRKSPILSFYDVPNWIPFYSAYQEGWGLYSEYLGEELGMYKDGYEMMGRYSYEILRASRLVVDTGLHYLKWSREEAIQYLMNHTALARGSAENEIDRYITWPGQACAYKLGEIKIKELRRKAETELGGKFNVKDFHMVILQSGGMPMNILETTVTQWIAETKASSQSNTATSPLSAHAYLTCIVLVLVSLK